MRACEFLTKEDAAAILTGYDLGALQQYACIERGYVNEKWLLETDRGCYLLKRRHDSLRKPALVQAQHSLVYHLRRAGFPAPALASTRYGNKLLVHRGEVYELQEYIPGEPFDALQSAHLPEAARMLGRYHSAVRGFEDLALHRSTERYGCAALSRTVGSLQETWRPMSLTGLTRLFHRLEEHARDLEFRYPAFGRLPHLVIHGDYHEANLIYQGNQIVGVVDYDLAHWSLRAMEVAEAVIAFCTDPGLGLGHIVYTGVLNMEQVMSFLSAYQEVVPLAQSEIQALPDLIRTIWLCAALDPPLEPLLCLEAAPRALPEILTLADWAVANESALARACLPTQESGREKASA